MIVSELIEQLAPLAGSQKPIFASIPTLSTALFFLQTMYGNGKDFPALGAFEEEPLPQSWSSQNLLTSLHNWQSEENDPAADVLLRTIYEYPDESYDLRYFKVHELRETSNNIILIGDNIEYVDMREHYKAVDESMFDEEE